MTARDAIAPNLDLPSEVAEAVRPVFDALPPALAMADLLPSGTAGSDVLSLVESAASHPAIRSNLHLQAGLWLYVDDLEASHRISQTLQDREGAYWHAIMHRREGDFGNAKYWLRAAGPHPALRGFDAAEFVDAVARSGKTNLPNLVQMQRNEWSRLFEWGATHPT